MDGRLFENENTHGHPWAFYEAGYESRTRLTALGRLGTADIPIPQRLPSYLCSRRVQDPAIALLTRISHESMLCLPLSNRHACGRPRPVARRKIESVCSGGGEEES